MVTKSPKTRILGRRRFKNINPRVHLQKLDERLFNAYREGLPGTSRSTSYSIKEERSCFFTSEVDLNENDHVALPVSLPGERTSSCQCGYCSPYYEMKLRAHQDYLAAVEDQENAAALPYLCNLLQDNVYVPLVAGKRDAETQTAPRQYKYTCRECLSQFNNAYFFEQHLLVHRQLYECPYCSACFVSDKQLRPHVLLHLSKNFFECSYCSCAFPSKKLLIKHIGAHDKMFYECGECQAKFVTSKALKSHKKSHDSSGSMIHVFKVAAERDDDESESEFEVQEVTQLANVFEPERPAAAEFFYECDLCNLRFANEEKLRQHNVIHNRNAVNYLHVCTVCNGRFRANNHLTIHLRNAHKPRN